MRASSVPKSSGELRLARKRSRGRARGRPRVAWRSTGIGAYRLMSSLPGSSGSVVRDAITSEYLKRILTARVYDVAIESPLELAPSLSQRVNNRVLLKREDQQPVFSFKLRGAYNKMVQLSVEERARGVIAASAGNHAQGVALAARRLGCRAKIVMPTTTPELKSEAVRAL